jgi:hypothetical protein
MVIYIIQFTVKSNSVFVSHRVINSQPRQNNAQGTLINQDGSFPGVKICFIFCLTQRTTSNKNTYRYCKCSLLTHTDIANAPWKYVHHNDIQLAASNQ